MKMQKSGVRDHSPSLVLQSHCGPRPLKVQSDLHPKPERFSVPLTKLKKLACDECVAQFPRKTGNEKQRYCRMPQCARRHQEGTLTE